jgi:hypothetical protein
LFTSTETGVSINIVQAQLVLAFVAAASSIFPSSTKIASNEW